MISDIHAISGNTLFDLIIIGAGPAGLAASLEARRMNWRVAIIERASEPGGKTAQYTCKADEQCRQCGTCQVCDAIAAVEADPDIELFLSVTATRCTQVNTAYHVSLRSKTTPEIPPVIRTRRLLLATGFKPFDPALKPALGYGRFRNVISLENLEPHLKSAGNLEPFLLPYPSPAGTAETRTVSAAFIQCVGSRDETASANYCSQVCCRTALRLARLMIDQALISDATVFYTDLQTLDSGTRNLALDTASLSLICGLPAEVTRDPDGRLRLRYETDQSNTLLETVFDLVVLAGGIRPVQPLSDMTGLEDLTTDLHGFWQVSAAASHADILAVAGTASGPMDILSAMAHGRYAVRAMAMAPRDLTS